MLAHGSQLYLVVLQLCAGNMYGRFAYSLKSICQSHTQAPLTCTGTIDSNWTLSTLEELDLSSNELSGTLPSNWGQPEVLASLATLNLQSNNISGPIPAGETLQSAASSVETVTCFFKDYHRMQAA